MSSYKIVVARYNENIEWLNSVMNNCIIYNKGDKLGLSNEIILENVGREAETYLHYIIENYQKLPDIVIFTQGNISDHRGINNIIILLKYANDALLYGKSICSRDICAENWNCKDENNYYLHDNYKNKLLLKYD